MQQCIGQHGDDAGDVGEEEQIDDENRQEGQYLPDDLLQANFADAGGDEEVHADGRGDLADGEVDDHDNTEEGLIDAIGADQRNQNGGEQGVMAATLSKRAPATNSARLTSSRTTAGLLVMPLMAATI